MKAIKSDESEKKYIPVNIFSSNLMSRETSETKTRLVKFENGFLRKNHEVFQNIDLSAKFDQNNKENIINSQILDSSRSKVIKIKKKSK